MTLQGAETWKLWKEEHNKTESFKCGDGEGWRSAGLIV
jgi:hypothetical protein